MDSTPIFVTLFLGTLIGREQSSHLLALKTFIKDFEASVTWPSCHFVSGLCNSSSRQPSLGQPHCLCYGQAPATLPSHDTQLNSTLAARSSPASSFLPVQSRTHGLALPLAFLDLPLLHGPLLLLEPRDSLLHHSFYTQLSLKCLSCHFSELLQGEDYNTRFSWALTSLRNARQSVDAQPTPALGTRMNLLMESKAFPEGSGGSASADPLKHCPIRRAS